MSSMDDRELVQAKLDGVQTGYVELQDWSRRRADMLRQARANARLFGEDEVELMTWLSEVHGRLAEVSVQDYRTDVLEKQRAEQLVPSAFPPPPSLALSALRLCASAARSDWSWWVTWCVCLSLFLL